MVFFKLFLLFLYLIVIPKNMVKEATSLKLDKEVFEKAKIQAKNENRTMANFIETLLIKYLDEIEKQEIKNPGE